MCKKCGTLVYFFSSRRRHTRWPRDWSSDVCSSDLGGASVEVVRRVGEEIGLLLDELDAVPVRVRVGEDAARSEEIGRASCRERGYKRRRTEKVKKITSRMCRRRSKVEMRGNI